MQTKSILVRSATLGAVSVLVALPTIALACGTDMSAHVSHKAVPKSADRADRSDTRTKLHEKNDRTVTVDHSDNKDKDKTVVLSNNNPEKDDKLAKPHQDKDTDADGHKPKTTPAVTGKGGKTSPVAAPVIAPTAASTITPVVTSLPQTGADMPIDVIVTIAGAGSAAVGLVHYKLRNHKR